MSHKAKCPVVVLVLLIVAVLWCLFLPTPSIVFKPYDSARLAIFVRRVADTDRVVGTYTGSFVSVTVTGEDAKKIARAVSSASPARPGYGMDWACIYAVKATFLKGTNVLDDIEMCGGLFLLHHTDPPYRYDSGALKDLVYIPVTAALRESEMKKFESQ
jgi:hypothetical protein